MLKRIAVAVLLIVWASVSFAVELRFVAWDYKMSGERGFYESLVRDFERTHPDIKVKFTLGEWSGGAEQQLTAHQLVKKWCDEGKGADIVILPDIWLVEFLNFIEPYDDYAPPNKAREYFPVLYRKGVINERWLAPVWATSTKALIYRKDLFDKAGLHPPRTWSELLNCALKLHDPPRVYAFGLAGKCDYDTSDNFYYFFWSAGGELIRDGRAAINSEAGLKSLRFLRDLIFEYRVTQPDLTQHHRHDVEALFEQGKIAMTEDGPWLVENVRKRAPHLKIGVAPLPIDKFPVTQIITDHIVIMKYSPLKREAAEFVTFATQDKYRLAFTKLGMVPEKPSIASDEHFQADPAWKVFVDIIPTGKSIPKLPWESVELTMQKVLNEVYAGRMEPKAALDEAAAAINKVLERKGGAR